MKILNAQFNYFFVNCFLASICLVPFSKSYSQNAHASPDSTISSILSSAGNSTDKEPMFSNSHRIETSTQKKRSGIIGGASLVGYGSSFVALSDAWFKGSSHSSFHFFNDTKEWLQTDKFGHAWTAYNTGRISAALWSWTGTPRKKAVWIGGGIKFYPLYF